MTRTFKLERARDPRYWVVFESYEDGPRHGLMIYWAIVDDFGNLLNVTGRRPLR